MPIHNHVGREQRRFNFKKLSLVEKLPQAPQ